MKQEIDMRVEMWSVDGLYTPELDDFLLFKEKEPMEAQAQARA
jgi:hypothetical protein